jgi:protein involved in polysaccharide export with SLBB domain
MHHSKAEKVFRCAMSVIVLFACLFKVADVGAQDTGYRLASGDRIKVTVYGHEDLSGEFDLDSEGNISLPLIQEVSVSGLTVDQLELAITNKLQPDYLKHPKVSVEVLNYRPFYILGEVKTPGSYPFVNGMTVLNAVALAGGYTYRARTKAVLITRPEGGEQKQIRAGSDTPVLPGDVIEVPERFF